LYWRNKSCSSIYDRVGCCQSVSVGSCQSSLIAQYRDVNEQEEADGLDFVEKLRKHLISDSTTRVTEDMVLPSTLIHCVIFSHFVLSIEVGR
jgi:hypothetical protein